MTGIAGGPPIGRRAALAAGLAGLAAPALAQDFPARPVRVIVPWSPGALVDNTTRVLADAVRDTLGQPFVVENKAGASGTIAAAEVARSAPDGYTLLSANASQMTIAPLVQPNLPYRPIADLVPVTQIAEEYEMLVGGRDLPVGTVGELIAWLKERPGRINFSSAGVGSVTHLLGEMFKVRAGVDIVHIPFRGGAPAVGAVLSGDVSLTFASASSIRPHYESGRAKVFAVPAARRSRWMPEVPTLTESGVEGMEIPFWIGLVAPARTPAPVVAALRDGVHRALREPRVAERYETMGIEVVSGSGEAFAAMMAAEAERWRQLFASARIAVE